MKKTLILIAILAGCLFASGCTYGGGGFGHGGFGHGGGFGNGPAHFSHWR